MIFNIMLIFSIFRYMKGFFLFTIIMTVFTGFSQETIELTDLQINQILEAHNMERRLVNEPDLIWNEDLAIYALEWAENLTQKNNGLVHRKPNKYGENLAYFFGEDVSKGVLNWNEEKLIYIYEEIDKFNYKETGHYSQIIWKKTTEVGCGCVRNKDGVLFLVCNYNPPGNFLGEKPY